LNAREPPMTPMARGSIIAAKSSDIVAISRVSPSLALWPIRNLAASLLSPSLACFAVYANPILNCTSLGSNGTCLDPTECLMDLYVDVVCVTNFNVPIIVTTDCIKWNVSYVVQRQGFDASQYNFRPGSHWQGFEGSNAPTTYRPITSICVKPFQWICIQSCQTWLTGDTYLKANTIGNFHSQSFSCRSKPSELQGECIMPVAPSILNCSNATQIAAIKGQMSSPPLTCLNSSGHLTVSILFILISTLLSFGFCQR